MTKTSSMGKTAASGASYVGIAQVLRVFLTLLSTIIVARLLTPADYGVMAMVAPVTAFLLLFQNLGLSHAAIQAKTLSAEQSNALFWVNMTASAAICLVLLALSPVVAWFYDDPRPGYVTAASAATVLMGGSTIQHLALLNRDLRFARLSAIDMTAAIVGFVATVAAAAAMRSYWALWIGAFIGATVSRSMVWRASRWRPSLKISFVGSGKLIRFGGAVTGFHLLNFLHRNLDNILIGKVWGPGPLGLYDRSYRLMMFPLQNVNAPLGRVILPILSRLQDEPGRYRRTYLVAVRAIMFVTVPAVAVAAATSDRLIPFLLGDRWSSAAPIFFWLSLAAILQPIGNSLGWLFISAGRPGALLKWAAFQMSFMVPAFVIAVQWGPAAVAAVYFFVGLASTPLAFAYSVRGTSVRALDLYAVCVPPALSAVIVWTGITWLMADWATVPLLCLALPLSYMINLAALCVSREGREAVRAVYGLASSAISARLGTSPRKRRRREG